jgi:predicted hotdog family 3-hydroxylacyl-ACP dehydratase
MELLDGDELIALIPQRPPFVMISKLLNADAESCRTSFIVSADNVLCDNGKLNPSGLIENIAQTCAAMKGYECKKENKNAPLGFIGDVKDFHYSKLPGAGEEIQTEIVIENKVFDVTLISGKITLDGEEIASCKMKIFVQNEANPS